MGSVTGILRSAAVGCPGYFRAARVVRAEEVRIREGMMGHPGGQAGPVCRLSVSESRWMATELVLTWLCQLRGLAPHLEPSAAAFEWYCAHLERLRERIHTAGGTHATHRT
jgi:hypothetical protein